MPLKWSSTDQVPIFHDTIIESAVSVWNRADGSVPATIRNYKNFRYVAITTKRNYDLDDVLAVFLAFRQRAGGVHQIGNGKAVVTQPISVEEIQRETTEIFRNTRSNENQSYSFPIDKSDDPSICVIPGFVSRKNKPVSLIIFIMPCTTGNVNSTE